MFYRDWDDLGDETLEDGSVIHRFRSKHTNKVEEVKLTALEAKVMTWGEVCERLYRQSGMSRWQDEFASMLSNMLKR